MSAVVNTHRVEGAGDAGRARLRVPWSTVFPLAVVAAFGNGFWLVVVRGAVGAVEGIRTPFAAWLEESALLLPVYVFAVLAALTVALRWFGPDRLRVCSFAATLLLVVLASTLAGITVQAVSAVYDYRLESAQVASMAARMPTCGAACVADQQQATLLLQLRALGLNGLVMLMSNVVLLGFVVAFRGGRLDVASPQGGRTHRPSFVWPGRAPATRPEARPSRHDHRRVGCGRLERALVVGLLAAAAIHATVIREHLAVWPTAGVFFILLSIAEVGAAALVLGRLRRPAFVATVAVTAGPVQLWLCSRTTGLPFGPDPGVPEPVGLTDLAASLLETTTLVLALAVLAPGRRPRPLRVTEHLFMLVLVGVIGLAVVGVAAGLGLVGAGGGMNVGL